jgi:hypothetical protein
MPVVIKVNIAGTILAIFIAIDNGMGHMLAVRMLVNPHVQFVAIKDTAAQIQTICPDLVFRVIHILYLLYTCYIFILSACVFVQIIAARNNPAYFMPHAFVAGQALCLAIIKSVAVFFPEKIMPVAVT